MAAVKIYFPIYMVGADGKKSYEYAVVTGTVTTGPGNTVPEGEPMVNSRVMASTPPLRLQPKGNR